ncbi:hypothetical protein BN978_06003 [Mycolicibacterium mageritense DSM 44476 = CIP 104973]|nr:hypothetical protein BN978_06003 [Mycolicibacterium mageritense DSM 44476 = CIP 104973]
MSDTGQRDRIDRRACEARAVADENSFVLLDKNADNVDLPVLGSRKFACRVGKVPSTVDTDYKWLVGGGGVELVKPNVATSERANARAGRCIWNVEDVYGQSSVWLPPRPRSVDHRCRSKLGNDHRVNALTAFQLQPMHKISGGLDRFETAFYAHGGNAIRDNRCRAEPRPPKTTDRDLGRAVANIDPGNQSVGPQARTVVIGCVPIHPHHGSQVSRLPPR